MRNNLAGAEIRTHSFSTHFDLCPLRSIRCIATNFCLTHVGHSKWVRWGGLSILERFNTVQKRAVTVERGLKLRLPS